MVDNINTWDLDFMYRYYCIQHKCSKHLKKCNFDYLDIGLKSTGLDLFSSNESAFHLHIKNLTIVLFAGFYGRTSAHFIAITGNKYVIILSLHTFIFKITIVKF